MHKVIISYIGGSALTTVFQNTLNTDQVYLEKSRGHSQKGALNIRIKRCSCGWGEVGGSLPLKFQMQLHPAYALYYTLKGKWGEGFKEGG